MFDKSIHDSVWLGSDAKQYSPQMNSLSVDVAIVGGGITGLTAATLLKAAGKKVAVIDESGTKKLGTTPYSSAMLAEHFDLGYPDLMKDFGNDNAQRVAKSRRNSLSLIETLAHRYNNDCKFERVNAYYYSEDSSGVEDVRDEYNAAQQLGVSVTMTNNVPLPFVTQAGVCYGNQAIFDPVKYLQGLASGIEGDGSFIFENTRVLEIERASICQVKTQQGIVSAPHVILATHSPIAFSFLQIELEAYRTYLLAMKFTGEEPPANFENAIFWDTEDPYHYFRHVKNDKGLFLIVGAEDHITGQEDDTESCFKALEEYAKTHFPVGDVEYHWSSQYYNSLDGLPYIGKLNDATNSANIYVATGYGGDGLTFGTVAGQLLTDLIIGNPNECAEIYKPSRGKSLSAIGQLVTMGVKAVSQFVGDRLQPVEATTVAEIDPDEGKIMEVSGEKIAVYKDANGELFAMSAKCTHLGCIVNWNTAEKSWDCPCHGGRFDPKGNVINPPPQQALASRTLNGIVKDDVVMR
jgi:glycine/D-amino acid oxidase-like deaminating enzyme/nitrite reductase/ring-hydroxylating ferredoxin subunit